MGSWNKGRNVTVVTRKSVLMCAVIPGEQGDRTMTYRVNSKWTQPQTRNMNAGQTTVIR